MAQRLDDLIADAHVRRQRGQRVLKNHGDLRAANAVQPRLGHLRKIFAAIEEASLGAPIIGKEADSSQQQLAFARSRFADYAEAFALGDIETDILDRMHLAVGCRKADMEILGAHDGRS